MKNACSYTPEECVCLDILIEMDYNWGFVISQIKQHDLKGLYINDTAVELIVPGKVTAVAYQDVSLLIRKM